MIIFRFLLMVVESIVMSVFMSILMSVGAILIFVTGGDAMGYVNLVLNEMQKSHKRMANYVING